MTFCDSFQKLSVSFPKSKQDIPNCKRVKGYLDSNASSKVRLKPVGDLISCLVLPPSGNGLGLVLKFTNGGDSGAQECLKSSPGSC